MRFPLLLAAAAALFLGVYGGLQRLGWSLPQLDVPAPGLHGPLMASGFLGTVIGLERAVALRRWWAWLGPALSAASTVAALAGEPRVVVAGLASAAALMLVGAMGVLLRLQPAPHHVTMALGAACWLGAGLLWAAGLPVPTVVPWWAAFIVLTIAGERQQLSRLVPVPAEARRAFLLIVGVIVVSLVIGLAMVDVGLRLLGAALMALAVWLGRYDLARRTIHGEGLPRYVAVCLYLGYAWLAVAGALALTLGAAASAGPWYDATLHAIFLGFAFSMIFGHAPIILPSVLHLPVPFTPAFYAPLALLHASLALRVGGDLAGAFGARGWGGLLNAAALVAFAMLVATRTRSRREEPTQQP